MIYFSALIPERDSVGAVGRRLPELCQVMSSLGQPFEVIVVDDGSRPAHRELLASLLTEFPPLRAVVHDQAAGLDAALTSGMTAARGEIVVAIEAGDRYDYDDVPRLVDRLARADFVAGRRRRGRAAKIALSALQAPRRLLLGRETRDPDCLFWAARREALLGVELARGMHRYLPNLVAARGYRVGELHVAHRWHARRSAIRRSRPHPFDLLAAWWTCRRSTAVNALELFVETASAEKRTTTRIDPPQPLGAGPTTARTTAGGRRDAT